MSDAFTFQSNSWNDDDPEYAAKSYKQPVTQAHTLNAALMVGGNSATDSDGDGEHDDDRIVRQMRLLRFLEDWNSTPVNYTGSIVSMWDFKHAVKEFRKRWRPPYRNYRFDQDFLNDWSRLPAGTPMVVRNESVAWSEDVTRPNRE